MKTIIKSGDEALKTFFSLTNAIISREIYEYDIETIRNMTTLFLNNLDCVIVHNWANDYWYWPVKLNITIVVNNQPNVFTFTKKKPSKFVGISVVAG